MLTPRKLRKTFLLEKDRKIFYSFLYCQSVNSVRFYNHPFVVCVCVCTCLFCSSQNTALMPLCTSFYTLSEILILITQRARDRRRRAMLRIGLPHKIWFERVVFPLFLLLLLLSNQGWGKWGKWQILLSVLALPNWIRKRRWRIGRIR